MDWTGRTYCSCRGCFATYQAEDTRIALLCLNCLEAGCSPEGRQPCRRRGDTLDAGQPIIESSNRAP